MRSYFIVLFILFATNVLAQTNNEVLGGAGDYWCENPANLGVNDFGSYCAGTGAGSSITSGDRNVFVGDNAGMTVSSGSFNTMVGESAGLHQTTVSDSTFIGYQAGFSNITGGDNTFIGKTAGFSNITGGDNTFIGKTAGFYNTATDGTFVGSEAGYHNTTGFDNTFIGEQAGYHNTKGGENVFVGEDSGYFNITGSDNTAIGNQALLRNVNGRYNTAIGNEAGSDIGYGATNYRAARNTVVGSNAGIDIGNGVGNTCIGDNACPHSEHADFNTFVGLQAGFDNNRTNINSTYNAQRNTGLGTYAGYTNREGTDNVWIGAFSDSGSRLSGFSHIDEIAKLQNGQGWSPGAAGTSLGYDYTIFRTTVMGAFASAGEDDSIAIGYNARSDNKKSIAIGTNVSGIATDDITLGYNASNTGDRSITIGNTSSSTHANAITIGYGSDSHADNTAIIGNATTVSLDPNTDAVTALGSSSYRYDDVFSNKISVNAASTSAAEIDLFADAGAANDDKWTISVANGGDFSVSSFASGVDVNKLSIANTGNVVIAGDLALNSDRRLKTNITPILNSLDTIMLLDGKSYYWKDENRQQGEHFGFIAQELEQVLPQLVSHDKAGIKSVNYQGVVPVLVNAVNELNLRTEEQGQLILKQGEVISELRNLILQQQALIGKLSQ